MSPNSPQLPLHRFRVYNPGHLSDEELKAAFVVRQELLQSLLRDLDGEKPSSRPLHQLIVGQRGMGKTTLLLRIAAELRTPPWNKRFIPLIFAEEQYTVDRLSKFWLNCLDSLADACDLEGDHASAERIDLLVARLDRSPGTKPTQDNPIALEVLRTLLQETERLGRRPVLLVDNLQVVFERIEPQQHAIREAITSPRAPVFIAAAPQVPASMQDYGAAFYDQFKPHFLAALSVDLVRSVLMQLAEIANRPEVTRRITAHPERLQVLHQLTGGVPRTIVLLFHLFAEEFSPSVYHDLEKLLDDVTPLYKARYEELAPQMQKVVGTMAEHWDPCDVKTLTTLADLTNNQISTQLDRLRKLGIVEEVPLYDTKRNGYQLAERFFNIWLLMRQTSRRQRRQVEWLSRFLEVFFSPAERETLARSFAGELSMSADRARYGLAIAHSVKDASLRGDVERNVQLVALREKARAARKRFAELVDLNSLPTSVRDFADLHDRLVALLGEELAQRVLGDRKMFQSGERQKLATLTEFSDVDRDALEEQLAANREYDEESWGTEAVDWFSARLQSGQLTSPEIIEDWERTLAAIDNCPSRADLATSQIPLAMVDELSMELRTRLAKLLEPKNYTHQEGWVRYGYLLVVRLQLNDLAETAYRHAIGISPNDPEIWNDWANLLAGNLGRYSEAEVAYRRSIELGPNEAFPWLGLGALMHRNLKRFDDAERAYRKAIECDPHLARAWNSLGNLLHDDLGRVEEAEKAYRRAIELDPDFAFPWNNLGQLLVSELASYDEGARAYRKAIELEPLDGAPWNNLGCLLCDNLNRYDDAKQSFERCLKLEPENTTAKLNLIFLHRDFLGEANYAKELLEEFEAQHPALADANVDCLHLHHALFAAYDRNWGMAEGNLLQALECIPNGIPNSTSDDWCRATAVLLKLGYGADFQKFLETQGADAKLRPFFAAVEAHVVGTKDLLLNYAPEVRKTAKWFFDQIELRRQALWRAENAAGSDEE